MTYSRINVSNKGNLCMTRLNDKTIIIIPIRMDSSRLPGKFHQEIAGKSMVLHVIDRARESKFTNIFVACDHEDHFKLVSDYGVRAVMTSVDHQSGSDRSYEALQIIDPEGKFEYILNLQGDMPFFDPETLVKVMHELDEDQEADISTMLAPLNDHDDIHNPNVVNAVFDSHHHAMYFSRLPVPFSMDAEHDHYYKHVGIYAYRKEALAKYVNLPQSKLEKIEKLEQLRALENKMIIRVGITDDVPISVDTPEDLEKARQFALSLK